MNNDDVWIVTPLSFHGYSFSLFLCFCNVLWRIEVEQIWRGENKKGSVDDFQIAS